VGHAQSFILKESLGMTASPLRLTRRSTVAALAAPLMVGWAAGARAAMALPSPAAPVAAVPFPDGVTILVAGPDGAPLCHWGEVIAAAFGKSLPPSTAVHLTCAGGTDGVTGANQFDARVPPDGSTVLLTPGFAALDWLVGDPRTHFDAGHWLPVMAGIAPAVVMARNASVRPGQVVRIAASSPAGPQLPAMLGLDLLGTRLAPRFGLIEQSQIVAAFTSGAVDAVLAWGEHVPQQVAALRNAGAKPLFTLGQTDPDTQAQPGNPDVPTLVELHQSLLGDVPDGPRLEAYRAAAAATQLEFALVLPQLTSAAMVALWRRTAEQAVADPDVQAMAEARAVQPLHGVSAAAATAGVAIDTTVLLDLRSWLASRFNWRPS
jgi:hypothetical protein